MSSFASRLLNAVYSLKASDLFLTVGSYPCAKINGEVRPLTSTVINNEECLSIITSFMTDEQKSEYFEKKELNFAINASNLGRYRASAFYQKNNPALVLRRIETIIPTLDSLNLPTVLKDIALTKRGLVIFVGATGTGKSTSLAAMINHRNKNTQGHIITIEDPIEFIHPHEQCIITQREVGIDTDSFEIALKNTLRQAPDVILIGEVRSRETMEHAIAFAETGHLCLCTLHANNANQALDRIIHFFPADRHRQIWMDLSLNLKAVIAQQLIPNTNDSRSACLEILINTPLASDMIRKGEVSNLKDLMKRSTELGMKTFDDALFDLYNSGFITYENALLFSDAPNDLRLKIKLQSEVNGHHLFEQANNYALADLETNTSSNFIGSFARKLGHT